MTAISYLKGNFTVENEYVPEVQHGESMYNMFTTPMMVHHVKTERIVSEILEVINLIELEYRFLCVLHIKRGFRDLQHEAK